MVNTENQQPEPEQPQQPQQLVRVRRTHTDDLASSYLSELTLYDKLSMNKEIEEKNKERRLKKLKNIQDPVAYPDPGSETASLITIDEEEIDDLKDQSMFNKLLSILPTSLIQRINRETRHEKEEKEKRKRDDNSKSSSDDTPSREIKRRCMDGDRAAERIVGFQNPIDFSEIMYMTDNHTALPLPFFRNKNIRYIIDCGATLPTVKSNPREGESKGYYILDITKLTNIFGAELTIDFGQWHEAANNCYRFQRSRDKNGESGSFALWWSQHFEFFNNQEDKIEMYDAWKSLELRLRQEYRTQPTRFNANYYVAQYEMCKSEHRMRLEWHQTFSKQPNARDDNPREGSGYRGGRSNSSRSRGGSTSSFPAGSRRSSLPVCCILCGEKGHPVSRHYNGTTPTKGSDGKPIWAKIANAILCNPEGQSICINFNVMGSRGCYLTKCERAHVCSFCGSKQHHAFSWMCRTRPYSE